MEENHVLLLSAMALAELLGVSRRHIYRLKSAGKFGLPLFVGPALTRGFHSPILHLALAFAA